MKLTTMEIQIDCSSCNSNHILIAPLERKSLLHMLFPFFEKTKHICNDCKTHILMNMYFITGIGTDVGKTVASAIVTEALEADYWKPIQAGGLEGCDTKKVQSFGFKYSL